VDGREVKPLARRIARQVAARVGLTGLALELDDLESIAWYHLLAGTRFVEARVVDELRDAGARRPHRTGHEIVGEPPARSSELAALELADAWRWVLEQVGAEDAFLLEQLVAESQRPLPGRRMGPEGRVRDQRDRMPSRCAGRKIAAALGVTESAISHRRRKMRASLLEIFERSGCDVEAYRCVR
jgi:hypothetical protein